MAYVHKPLSVSALLSRAASTPGGVCKTARVKTFPDGSVEVLACDKAIFHPVGWEMARKPARAPRRPATAPEVGQDTPPAPADPGRSMRRARAQVRDLALANPFRWFVTLTLDPARVDRHDMAAITRKLNAWLDNQVRRHGLAYVLVPERHKDGAIHFHGFFNDAVAAVDSGHTDRQGHPIFNLPGWSLGFTTALELYGDYHAAVGYVCKYIGKQGEKPGGRWYYSGGNLRRPEVSFSDVGVRDIQALAGEGGVYAFQVPEAGLSFAMLRTRPTQDIERMSPPPSTTDRTDVRKPRHIFWKSWEFTFSGLSSTRRWAGPQGPAPRGCTKCPPKSGGRKGASMTTAYLLDREVSHVLAALTPSNRLVCRVCLHTGLRLGDVLALRTQQLQPHFWVRESKTGKRRQVGLPAGLLADVKEQAGRSGPFQAGTPPSTAPARPSGPT